MTGIAIPLFDLPTSLHDTPLVKDRRYVRDGLEEVQFHWWQTPTVLPVRWEGSVRLFRWGSKARRGTRLPCGGWVAHDQVKAGVFHRPEPVVIPAGLGFERGVWFPIHEGARGVVVWDGSGPVVYVVTRPATNYYRNLTEQTPVMAVLINQVI